MSSEDQELVTVALRMEQATPRLVDQQLTALRRFHSYRRVPEEDLRRSCERNVVRVVTSLRGAARLPPEIIEDERQSGRRRALQGIPSDDVVEAYRAVLGLLRDEFLAEAAKMSIPLESVLLGTRRLWELTDRFSSELVSARHQVDLDLVRREERERLTFLHNVLAGTLRENELVEGGSAYGIRPGRQYWVLRGRSVHGGTTEELVPRLTRATASRALAPLLGIVGGDVAGVIGQRPDHVPSNALVAVDGPVTASELHRSFVDATNLLDIAVQYEMHGLVEVADMPMRIAVAQNDRLGRTLYDKYIAPVLAESGIGETVVDSVRAYLDGRRSIPVAARTLNVHVNTLRYRLERFESMTGADLGDTVTILEVWWALQYTLISTER
ncbi:PucR family transcriptional regulator [Amycolatopsis pigmentata]|uniref:PucR family transcriptional regulator n=1 Tax=Amycolatopsis pigmentata TaxID=450801 RepID=A0ABW5FRV2_9PSEU